MKLELKHLAPYLPYGLKVSKIHVMHSHTGIGSIDHVLHSVNKGKSQYKPILRPLSDITKFEDIMDEFSENSWEIFENAFFVFGRSLNCFDTINYTIAELCFKYHLDIFGLIEQGLAIDINTLES